MRLSFFKLKEFCQDLKEDIKEVIENFFCYGNWISGLTLVVYDFLDYASDLSFFHCHFKSFCRNLYFFNNFEISFVIRFMNLYCLVFLRKGDEDYLVYKKSLKKCLFVNNMEMVVEICKNFWNFEEFCEVDLCLVNLVKYLNGPVQKKNLLLGFFLEIMKKSEGIRFENLEDNYFYFFFLKEKILILNYLKLKL